MKRAGAAIGDVASTPVLLSPSVIVVRALSTRAVFVGAWVAALAAILVGCSLASLDYLRDVSCAPNCGADAASGGEVDARADTGSDSASDAPLTGEPDADTDADAGEMATDWFVRCADDLASRCDIRTQKCCRGRVHGGTDTCFDAAVDCPRTDDIVARCDDAANCPSGICCFAGVSLFCTSLADCQGYASHGVACDPAAPVPCPNGAACDTGTRFCVGL